MADSNVTTVALGVKRTNCRTHYVLEGKRKSLLNTGLVKKSWLPDGKRRDSRGRVVRQKFSESEGRLIHSRYIAQRDKYMVYIDWSDEESERREQKAKPAQSQQTPINTVKTSNDKTQSNEVPEHLANFLEKTLESVAVSRKMVLKYLNKPMPFITGDALENREFAIKTAKIVAGNCIRMIELLECAVGRVERAAKYIDKSVCFDPFWEHYDAI